MEKESGCGGGCHSLAKGPHQEVQKKQLEQDETGSGPQDPLGMTMVLLV